MDINIHINKWDTAESTSIAGIDFILSILWRHTIYFLGKVFFMRNIFIIQSLRCHYVGKVHHRL
jgi:hypothetical protein